MLYVAGGGVKFSMAHLSVQTTHGPDILAQFGTRAARDHMLEGLSKAGLR